MNENEGGVMYDISATGSPSSFFIIIVVVVVVEVVAGKNLLKQMTF